MASKKLNIKADSLAEAYELLKLKVSDGYAILTVKTVHNDEPMKAKATGDTIDAAIAKARKIIPAQSTIIEEKTLNTPKTEYFHIKAFDEQNGISQAQSEIKNRFGKAAVFKGIKLIQMGSKGVFGIGKTPNNYKIEVFLQASVKIIYNLKAEIIASIVAKQEADGFIKHLEKLVELYDSSPRGEGFITHSSSAEPVRRIGEDLNRIDGMDAMLLAHSLFAKARPQAARNLEMVWDGIGSWNG